MRMIEDGQEIGGGVFPASDQAADKDAYAEAVDEAEGWLAALHS